MIPNYTLENKIGRSGKILWTKKLWGIYCIHCSDKQVCAFNSIGMKQFNPFRDLQYGGTTIGFRGLNYWFSDNTLVGYLLKIIFK